MHHDDSAVGWLGTPIASESLGRKCEMRNAKCEMRNADRGMLPVTTEPKTSEAFDLLSLNFAHFREDSSRATEALPRRFRRHAHTPARRYDRHLWLRHAALSPSVQKIY